MMATIVYLGANNLHGYSMMQLILTEILDLIDSKDFILDSYSKHSPIACFLEVHLEYPYELHDLYNNYQ